jgi:hypothetical protein
MYKKRSNASTLYSPLDLLKLKLGAYKFTKLNIKNQLRNDYHKSDFKI